MCLREVIRAANSNTLEAPPTVPGAAAHLPLKGQTQNGAFLLTLKNCQLFTCYIKNICGAFWAKTSHTHSWDISNIFYILWKGHFTTPLKDSLLLFYSNYRYKVQNTTTYKHSWKKNWLILEQSKVVKNVNYLNTL